MSDFEFRHYDTDDEARALLRSGDPARSLAPADPAALSDLLEDIMSVDLEVRPDAPEEGLRATGTRGSSRFTWLVAAAAAVIIAGVGGAAVSMLGTSIDDTPGAKSGVTYPADPGSEPDTGAVPGTTELSASAGEPGRCAVPTAEFIAAQEQAFSGQVTAIDGDEVTLQTADVFTGEVGETVVVSAPTAAIRSLIRATKFEVGGTYLVSATGGQVSVCGMTGKASGQLQTLYNQAFAR